MSEPQVGDIVRLLEEDIIFGRLQPRERLVEDVLIKRFGGKRHVVRQVLAELERMGIVVREQNKGAVVRLFSLREVEEIFEMRELLQERAAQRIALPGDPALLRRLKQIHAEHSLAVDARDLRTVYRLNNDFHDTLFGACGNHHLSEAITHYAWQAHAIRSYRIADAVLLSQAREEHAEMIEALERGDRQRLVRLCIDHIKPSKEAYLASRGAIEASLAPQDDDMQQSARA